MQSLTFLFLQISMELIVNDDGQMMREGVGLHYRDNYIKIVTLPLNDKTSAMIFYHTSEVKFYILPILCYSYKLLHILLFDITT